MAVPAGPTEKRYTGNGVSTIYTVPFLVIQSTDLAVYVDGERLISGYTHTGAGNPTSTITFTLAPALNAQIVLQLDVPFERLNDYQENGDFLSSTVNRDFDRLWQALKQLLRYSDRSLKLGQFDIDGQGSYRANGNRIQDLGSPLAPNDAVNKIWTEQYIGGLLGSITGPINNSANILLLGPDGVSHVVQDISNILNPLLGGALIGRSIRYLKSVKLSAGSADGELKTVAGRYNGETAYVHGFWDDFPGLGGGTFRWNASSTTPDDGGIVIQVSDVSTGRWIRQFDGPYANVAWFGAKGDGADDTEALLAAFATPYWIEFPAGDYRTSAKLNVKPGVHIKGAGGGRFNTDPFRTTYLRSLTAGEILLDQSQSTSTGQEDAFSIEEFFLIADNCIRMNDPTVLIADGATSPEPYLMKPGIRRCTFQPLTAGQGVGLSMSKVFDATVTENEFRQFDICILLNGVDLSDIHHNRLSLMYRYGILELSAQTFGSQTKIRNNDMVSGTQTTTIFVKTTARHVRIFDNYMEQGSGGASSITGFIDISTVSAPTYGANAATSGIYASVVAERNRLDGFGKVSSFVYRLQPVGAFVKLQDSGNIGPKVVSPARALLLTSGFLPLVGANDSVLAYYDIQVPEQQDVSLTTFRVAPFSASGSSYQINAQNVLSLNHTELRRGNGHLTSNLSSTSLVMLTTATGYIHLCPPPRDGNVNPWMISGSSYICKIIARSATAGQTIEALPVSNGTGTAAASTLTLTTQFQEYTLSPNIPGALITSTCGVALRRTTGGGAISGNVEILSITFTKI